MQDEDVEGIAAWLVREGLAGQTETALITGFCEACCAAGSAALPRCAAPSTGTW